MAYLPNEFPVTLPPGWLVFSVDRKPYKGFEIRGPDGDFILVYSHQPSPAGTFYRFLKALAHVVPTVVPHEDAVHGSCGHWLRRFNHKHGRDPYVQEVWDAAQKSATGEDNGATPI